MLLSQTFSSRTLRKSDSASRLCVLSSRVCLGPSFHYHTLWPPHFHFPPSTISNSAIIVWLYHYDPQDHNDTGINIPIRPLGGSEWELLWALLPPTAELGGGIQLVFLWLPCLVHTPWWQDQVHIMWMVWMGESEAGSSWMIHFISCS